MHISLFQILRWKFYMKVIFQDTGLDLVKGFVKVWLDALVLWSKWSKASSVARAAFTALHNEMWLCVQCILWRCWSSQDTMKALCTYRRLIWCYPPFQSFESCQLAAWKVQLTIMGLWLVCSWCRGPPSKPILCALLAWASIVVSSLFMGWSLSQLCCTTPTFKIFK